MILWEDCYRLTYGGGKLFEIGGGAIQLILKTLFMFQLLCVKHALASFNCLKSYFVFFSSIKVHFPHSVNISE